MLRGACWQAPTYLGSESKYGQNRGLSQKHRFKGSGKNPQAFTPVRSNLKKPSSSAGPEALLLIPKQQGGNRIKKSGKKKKSGEFGKRTKFRIKMFQKITTNSQTAYPHSARKLLRRSSHPCRANHLQRTPQQRSTKGTNPALLLFPGTLGVFQAQGNSERSDKLVSLMSLVFYTQLTVSFFCKRP